MKNILKSMIDDYQIWLWIIKNSYNPHMNECFFNRIGSNLPEQLFAKAEDFENE